MVTCLRDLRRRHGLPWPTAPRWRSRSSRIEAEGAMTPRKPVTDWATDWDHLDPRWREDPFPIWDELRRGCPIAHTERYQGAYLPTPYEAARPLPHPTPPLPSPPPTLH